MEERNPKEYQRLASVLNQKDNTEEVDKEPPAEGFINMGDRV